MAAAEPATAQADQLVPNVEDKKGTFLGRIASVRLSCGTVLSQFRLVVPLKIQSHRWASRKCQLVPSIPLSNLLEVYCY